MTIVDDIGRRMKRNYEDRTRYMLPRRTYTVIRLDGKAFHTWSKKAGLVKPYDESFAKSIDDAANFLFDESQGAVLAYTQSDEISLVLQDFDKPRTEAWFDGNVQKLASVSASLVTGAFNYAVSVNDAAPDGTPLAYFDARVFTIPDKVEVQNYLIWRQQDCIRNSIIGAAQAHFSHKDLHGKSCYDMKAMIAETTSPWQSYHDRFKFGGLITKDTMGVAFPFRENQDKLGELIPTIWENDNV